MTLRKENVMSTKNTFQEIFDRINSDVGLIFVDTPEETRLIREVYRKFNSHDVEFWSATQGLHRIKEGEDPDKFYPHHYKKTKARASADGTLKSQANILSMFGIVEEDCYNKIKPDEDPTVLSIYILRDADKFLCSNGNPAPIRALRDLIHLCSCAASTVIVSGFGISVPEDVIKDAAYVKLSYPKREEILNSYIPKLVNKIEYHNKIADTIIVGGGMAYTFAKAMGGAIGSSLCEDDRMPLTLELIEKAKAKKSLKIFFKSGCLGTDDVLFFDGA
jgi:hypothetical protein